MYSRYKAHALAYRIGLETNMPYAGEAGILPQRKGKLTMGKLKSSRLSYTCNLVKRFPELSISRRQSKYEVDFVHSVVSLISSSPG